MHAKLSLAFLLALFALQPVLADDPKPDASIKTKAIEAKVFLDDKVKADLALAQGGRGGPALGGQQQCRSPLSPSPA